METFEISVNVNGQNNHYQIRDYMHHEGEQCKYEIYKQGVFIVSFQPGPHKHLHICKNAGVEEEEVLNKIADQLEGYNI